jgi:hypothetical protein
VILIAVKNAAGLKLYAQRDLRQKISECDREYFDELLKDLHLRSNEDPEKVFAQISNLSVGPIITAAVKSAKMSLSPFYEFGLLFYPDGDMASCHESGFERM